MLEECWEDEVVEDMGFRLGGRKDGGGCVDNDD